MEQRYGSGITARRGLLLGALAIVGASAALATGRPLAAAGDTGEIKHPEVALESAGQPKYRRCRGDRSGPELDRGCLTPPS